MQACVGILEEPHAYYGQMLSIPVEIKLGLAWGEGKTWKEMPTREEWEVCAHELSTVRPTSQRGFEDTV